MQDLLATNLAAQCSALELPLLELAVPRVNGNWLVGDMAFARPEPAAKQLLVEDGWCAACCEGGPVLVLLKAACLELLAELNPFGRRDARTRFLEAQFTIHTAHTEDLVAAIASAGLDSVMRSFDEIYAEDFVRECYPGLTSDLIAALWEALAEKLPSLALRFAADPYLYRAGWPDITAVRNGQLPFREVKTTDKLHRSQIETLSGVILPEGLSCEIARLRPTAKRANGI